MKQLTVYKVPVQGYCGGVRQAIAKARKIKEENPDQKVTVLGALVHNRHVMDLLNKEGIETAESKGASRMDLLDTISSGTVIFTAHGVSSHVRKKAAARGLLAVDATCPMVLKTQQSVKEHIENGYEVFYIGMHGHPESESIYTESDHVHLITSAADIPENVQAPVFVTNQTTMSILDIQDLFSAIKARYPHAVIEDEICNATRVRQEAVLNLQGMDVLVVVGDPSSNNTRKLEETGQKAGIPITLRIQTADELDLNAIPDGAHVAVTSGASTPGWLTDAVIEKLNKA